MLLAVVRDLDSLVAFVIIIQKGREQSRAARVPDADHAIGDCPTPPSRPLEPEARGE